MHFDNVFYDTYDEVLEYPCAKEVWEEGRIVSLTDTDNTIGLFGCSDIIIAYGEDGNPNVITERIYKRNYKFFDWIRVRTYLHTKTSVIKQELGFNISISFGKDFIDYVHYKEDWWLWALEYAKHGS